jgi:hypothetical protein
VVIFLIFVVSVGVQQNETIAVSLPVTCLVQQVEDDESMATNGKRPVYFSKNDWYAIPLERRF